jgi:2-methylisocitrate lyase-like PEP mutase family enzyme
MGRAEAPPSGYVGGMDNSAQASAVAQFHALHQSGCFVLPNPWDVGSAIYLRHLGFKALATTSAGFAFSRGLSDGKIPRDEMLAHIRDIVAATSLPVNADYLNGFAAEPEGVAANVKLCVGTGVAGLSIEDSTGDEAAPLYDELLAIERVRAARRAIDESKSAVVLTARCEAWLVGHPDPLNIARKRLVAFAEAGADCLYAPSVREPEEISELVKAVAPKPLNVLVSRPGEKLSVANLADIGVRRISVGSALSAVAWGAFIRAAREIAESGTFDSLSGAIPFAEINGLFSQPR